MADARVTQGAVLLAEEVEADARVTQTAILYLHSEGVPANISQVALLYLAAESPCAAKRAQVWKITRRDETVYRFTTHDETVSWRNEEYSPCNSLSASAIEATMLNAIGGGDIEVNGLISDDSITEFDLANGLFDGAAVEVWLVPWNDPSLASDSPRRLLKGILGETTQSALNYTAQVFTASAKLAQKPLLNIYTPACRFEPGDGKCPVDVVGLTATGYVTAVLARMAYDRRSYRQFYCSSNDSNSSSSSSSSGGTFSTFYVYGLLTWVTGNNAGISSEIKSFDDGLVTLWEPMPHEIQISDQYSVRPGCAKTTSDHVNKFGLSMDSFGGFPDLPGLDAAIRGGN